MSKFKYFIFFLALIMALSAFCSCRKENDYNFTNTVPMKLAGTDTDEYISLGSYTGLEITAKAGTPRDIAAWNAVVENATVITYPVQQLYYYYDSLRIEYLYLADEYNIEYLRVLEINGLTEDMLFADAEKMTKKDLVLYALAKKEGLYLTDAEISAHKADYIKKIAEDYKLEEAYVKENMSDIILETMLYDKVSEFLIANNSIN